MGQWAQFCFSFWGANTSYFKLVWPQHNGTPSSTVPYSCSFWLRPKYSPVYYLPTSHTECGVTLSFLHTLAHGLPVALFCFYVSSLHGVQVLLFWSPHKFYCWVHYMGLELCCSVPTFHHYIGCKFYCSLCSPHRGVSCIVLFTTSSTSLCNVYVYAVSYMVLFPA